MKFPRMITHESKHYNYHYLALNKKQFELIGLEILKVFKDSGFLSKNMNLEKQTLGQYLNENIKKYCPDYDLESLTELSKSKYAKLKIKIEYYSEPRTAQDIIDGISKEFKEGLNFHTVVDKSVKALKEKDGKLAWQCINFFRDFEYQKINTIFFDNYRE